METDKIQEPEQWAKIELFGHTVLFAKVSKADMGDFIRVDIPNADGTIDQTRLYNPKAIYGVTFLEKALCLQLAAARNQTPVQSWELPKQADAVPALPEGDEFDYGTTV